MKMKLLLFMGLIAGSISLSLLFGATTYAAGENYKWINDTTIEATGGAYDSKIMTTKQFGSGGGTAVPIKKVTFVRDGNTNVFKATGSQPYYSTGANGTLGATKCDLQLSITATTLSAATLAVNNPIGTPCPDSTLTTTLAIGATDAGPDEKSITDAAAAAANPANPAPGEAAKVSTCKIDAIGWLLCPVMDFMSKVIDGAYAFVASLMVVKPITTDSSDAAKSMYAAWSIMRNFANVAFVIAFMMIIFSQMTSVGLNNYGIKRMLPRLIVAAILVNASYWICAIAVDISNILGASLNGLFTSAIPVLGANDRAAFVLAGDTSGGGWQGLVSAVLIGGAATAVLYATLSALVPALLAALIAILTVFIVLTMRQALIILLVVVSPLAFVAYLLPNTESLFKKWLGLFKTLLLMYPIIAMIFGASALASSVVMTSASGSKYAIAIQIMGALISIVPLALTPIIMKTAGGVLNRVGGFVNNPNKGPFDKLRKGAEGYNKNRQEYRRLKAMNGERSLPGMRTLARRKASREAILANRKSELSLSNAEYVAGKASENGTFADKLAEGAGQGAKVRAVASAESQLEKIHISNVDAQEAVIKNARLDPEALRELSQGKAAGGYDASNNPALQQAAQRRVFNTGDMKGINELLDQSGSWNKTGDAAKDAHGAKMQQRLADTIESSKFRPAYIGQGAIAGIRDGKVAGTDAEGNPVAGTTSAELKTAALGNNTYSAQKIATGDKEELADVLKFAMTDPNVSVQMKNSFAANAQTALTDPRLAAEVSKNLEVTKQIASLAPMQATQDSGTLNIPRGGTPNNSRTTPPNTSGSTGSNGFWTPGGRS